MQSTVRVYECDKDVDLYSNTIMRALHDLITVIHQSQLSSVSKLTGTRMTVPLVLSLCVVTTSTFLEERRGMASSH